MLGVIGAILGFHILARLFVWAFWLQIEIGDIFFDIQKWDEGNKMMYGLLGTLIGIFLLVIIPLSIFDGKKDDYSKHTCDYCGGKIKIGTGKHWKEDVGCRCACDVCLPTVVWETSGKVKR